VAQFIAFIPAILGAAGTLMGSSAQKQAAESQAMQLEQNAGQARAISQREAAERRRSVRYAQSRVKALAASSGAGASDPTVVNLIADLEGEGEMGALAALYEGEEQARGMEYSAKVARRTGQAASTAGALRAGGTILGAASSWYDKYGGGGAPGALTSSAAAGTAMADFANQNRGGIYSPRYA
jgi:hypothetical protein